MPVWHEATEGWVKEGQLVLLGITQEQHADRCRLLAQWKGFRWPILHDPINVMETAAVPLLTAIDEHGIVRSVRPRLDSFKKDFLDRDFPDDAPKDPARIGPALAEGNKPPDFAELKKKAEATDTAASWRGFGDALALWGEGKHQPEALASYARAVRLEPKDGPAAFRLGVCFRRRFESDRREPGDFQAAVDHWSRALEIDPNQYIWRRRIQQYGPRLEKPYAFYDWVAEAEKAIRDRGDEPVRLAVRPGGAEIARPSKSLPQAPAATTSPDPQGKVHRDKGLIRAEATLVPGRVRPGQAVRVFIVLRPDPRLKAHWNNEAEPLRVWIDPPQGWRVSEQLLESMPARDAVSTEDRTLDFEIVAPAGAEGKATIAAYALYHVCDEQKGQCQYLRLDIPIELTVGPEKPEKAP